MFERVSYSRARWPILFLWLVVVCSCKESSHSVVLRVEGNNECIPDVLVQQTLSGDVKSERIEHVLLPWEKQFDTNISALDADVTTSMSKCPQVQCQIVVDGKPVEIKADGKHAECKWKR